MSDLASYLIKIAAPVRTHDLLTRVSSHNHQTRNRSYKEFFCIILYYAHFEHSFQILQSMLKNQRSIIYAEASLHWKDIFKGSATKFSFAFNKKNLAEKVFLKGKPTVMEHHGMSCQHPLNDASLAYKVS